MTNVIEIPEVLAALNETPDLDTGASTKIIMMTPEFASTLLRNVSDSQRKKNKAAIARYAGEMTAGRWKFNGEAISIDQKGDLIQGQHRLEAVIEADCCIPMLIVYGLNTDAIDSMDQGYKRSTGQLFSMSGHKNSNNLAAFLASYCHYTDRNLHNLKGITFGREKALYDSDPKGFERTLMLTVSKELQGMGSRPMIGVVHYLASKIDQPKADHMLKALIEQDFDKMCPVRSLNKMLTQRLRLSMKNLNRPETFNAYATCFNMLRGAQYRDKLVVSSKLIELI